jgi:hypothetical protein
MNWTLIKEKYPKAWDKLSRFIGEKHIESFQYLSKLWRVELYDFFDEQGIIINIEYVEIDSFAGILYQRNGVCYEVDKNDNLYLPAQSTRTEAEEQAFLKAFEILESKLK